MSLAHVNAILVTSMHAYIVYQEHIWILRHCNYLKSQSLSATLRDVDKNRLFYTLGPTKYPLISCMIVIALLRMCQLLVRSINHFSASSHFINLIGIISRCEQLNV